MTEKLIELVPEKKTVWAIENDTMGMGKMLIDPRFCFYLEKLGDNKTKIVNESYYQPATLMVKIIFVSLSLVCPPCPVCGFITGDLQILYRKVTATSR